MTLDERDATPDDFDLFAAAQVELGLGAPADPTRWRTRAWSRCFFLVDGDRVAAYSMVHPYGRRGDVRQVVIFPPWRGKGLGKTLMAAAARRLRARGCDIWSLEVKEDNTPAIALYRSVGMQPTHPIARVVFSERDLLDSVDDARPEEYGDLENMFDLLPGKIADYAARPRARVLAVAGRGFALLFPDRRLAWPLWAADEAAAGALVGAAIAAADPGGPVEIAAEGEVAVAAVAKLAPIEERMVAMRGPIPAAPLHSPPA